MNITTMSSSIRGKAKAIEEAEDTSIHRSGGKKRFFLLDSEDEEGGSGSRCVDGGGSNGVRGGEDAGVFESKLDDDQQPNTHSTRSHTHTPAHTRSTQHAANTHSHKHSHTRPSKSLKSYPKDSFIVLDDASSSGGSGEEGSLGQWAAESDSEDSRDIQPKGVSNMVYGT
ncbi:hypothetical protein EON63_05140 [archaeon]|nr:MAG: hypothetical protein EON63_05140 [archaeon]